MKKLFSRGFTDRKQLGYAFLFLFLLCLGIALVSVVVQRGWPSDANVSVSEATGFAILGTTVYLPFSLPKSFGDTVGLTSGSDSFGEHSTTETKTMMAVYWPIIALLLFLTFRTRKIFVFAFPSIIFVVSSVDWLNVAIELILV